LRGPRLGIRADFGLNIDSGELASIAPYDLQDSFGTVPVFPYHLSSDHALIGQSRPLSLPDNECSGK
jgi:hypothetical protein